jgi:uncharacterized protein YyaL (SSP411 family)
MTAVQAMTSGGGWPLSVFLTPDLKPFFGGTYFPPDARYGKPGFKDLLREISDLWTSQREELIASSEKLTEALKKYSNLKMGSARLEESILDNCYYQFARGFDAFQGGFTNAPKFPRPVVLSFLLRYYARKSNQHALDMVLLTLRKMVEGGIHDHLGGGFHRCSVDALWRVPHFEKMLYDQAQLAITYLEAYQITRENSYAVVARDVLNYVLRDMQGPDGGFCSAEDADSEGEEGTFYLWSKGEIDALLGEEEGKIFCHCFGVSEEGNFEHGKNVLHATYSVDETVKAFGISAEEVRTIIDEGKRKLSDVRRSRIRPHLDDKVLTSWNGLVISAFSRAYQVLEDPQYLAAAERGADFMQSKLSDLNGKTLFHCYRDGEAKIDGYLNDYAFLAQGFLDLYEASFKMKWLKNAIELTEIQNSLFWDGVDGGFFFDAGKERSMLVRSKIDHDSAEPSGNSIAVLNLLRLSQMTGHQEWYQLAERTLALFAERLRTAPTEMPQMLVALDFYLVHPKQIIVAGEIGSEETKAVLRVINERFIPSKVVMLAEGGEGQKELSEYNPIIQNMGMRDGKPTVYLCENFACKLPINDTDVLREVLSS